MTKFIELLEELLNDDNLTRCLASVGWWICDVESETYNEVVVVEHGGFGGIDEVIRINSSRDITFADSWDYVEMQEAIALTTLYQKVNEIEGAVHDSETEV